MSDSPSDMECGDSAPLSDGQPRLTDPKFTIRPKSGEPPSRLVQSGAEAPHSIDEPYHIRSIATPAGPAVLRRTDRATLAISVLPDGTLDLVAPHDCTEADIVGKVGKRLRWIVRQRTTFADMNRDRLPLRYESGATHRYLGRQYRLKIRRGPPAGVRLIGAYFHITTPSGSPAEAETALNVWLRGKALEQFTVRLAKWEPWCAARKLPLPRLRLLRMPKRWGSSHRDGRIYLNPDLVKAPAICIDYVIAHEVCHLKHPRHDRSFFKLLSQVFPTWREVKTRLEQVSN